jgi:hypothetical protein
MANEGDLKVWWIPQVPCEAFEVPVSSAKEGASLMNTLAEYDAFQFLNGIKPDYSNAGGLQVYTDGEWLDWEDPETFEDDSQDVFPQPNLGWCARLTQ